MEEGSHPTVARVGLLLGPLACAALLLMGPIEGLHPVGQRTLAVTAWLAVWWFTEPIPSGLASLLPLAMFPALGIMGADAVARGYQRDPIFLFLGGFLVALAAEHCGLHRRMAQAVLRTFGTSPRKLLFGYLAAVSFISWWFSNTATTLLFLPSARAIADHAGAGTDASRRFGSAILLGTALASSIGGMASPIGTVPNTILVGQIGGIGFSEWMRVGIPVWLILIAVLWVVMTFVSVRIPKDLPIPAADAGEPSPLSRDEKRVAAVFLAMVSLWFFREGLDVGAFRMRGWGDALAEMGWLPKEAVSMVKDGTVAVAAAVLLAVLPSQNGGKLLTRDHMKAAPWDVLVLLGSSFALADAFELPKNDPGSLSSWIAASLRGLTEQPLAVQLATMALVVTFFGEFASNIACAALLVPIGIAIAKSTGADPLVYGFTITLATSCSFMLPVGTPPNALVYATGRIPLRMMLLNGVIMDVVGALVVAGVVGWVRT